MKLVILLSLIFQVVAFCDSTPVVDCNDSLIHKIKRPYYDGVTDSPTFPYSYRWVNQDRSKPVFIYIPGGPGQTSIRQVPGWLAGENVILTDPRGAGCNEQNPDTTPDHFYRSVEIANDIIAIIKQERLDNYVLYGTSFGTMVATEVASKMANETTLPEPKSVLLESIMGRASRRGEWDREFSKQWKIVRDGLPKEIREKIVLDEWPVSTKPEDLGEGVAQWLTLGRGMISNLLIGLFTSTDKAQQEEVIKDFFHYDPNAFSKAFLKLHRNISCREFSHDQSSPNEPHRLVRGSLIPGKKSYCDGIPYSEKYDAGNWPVDVPLFYFAGENDPATPVWQAEYHFMKETTAPRFLAVVGGGAGHGPLGTQLYFVDGCGKSVLDSVASGSFDEVKTSVKSCKTEIKVSIALPGCR